MRKVNTLFKNKEVKGCILPWIHVYGRLDGTYALCCHSENYQSSAKTFGNPGQRPLEVWNSDKYKKTRKMFLNGTYPEECTVCYELEKNGQSSHRERINHKYKRYQRLQNKTNEDGSLSSPPVYLDFRFGNLCNFRCRMCGPDASTSWFKEKHLSPHYVNSTKPGQDHWTKNDEFWQDMEKIYHNIDTIYFAGGEPFVQDGHYKMLEFLISKGKTDVELQYNTNLSYRTHKKYNIKQLWDNFANVKVWPSIDGYGKRAEYSRKGLDWDVFAENVKLFKNRIETFSVVGSIYTISTNIKLINWIKSQGLTFHITNLTSPIWLDSCVLPKESKAKINEEYKTYLKSKYQFFTDYELKNILDSLRHMNRADNTHLLEKFKTFTTGLDLYRNENFESTFPEFASWYQKI